MRIQKVINTTFNDSPEEGDSRKNFAGGISAVVSANVGEGGDSGPNYVSSRQQIRIVQKGGRTQSSSTETRGGNDE